MQLILKLTMVKYGVFISPAARFAPQLSLSSQSILIKGQILDTCQADLGLLDHR